MTLRAFSIARLPRIEFGPGAFAKVPDIVAGFGRRVLLVTGGRSLEAGPHWAPLLDGLAARGVDWRQVRVSGEPSPQVVDEAVQAYGWSGPIPGSPSGGGRNPDESGMRTAAAGAAKAGAETGGGARIDVVLGIGGGSALDAAKAIAGLLRVGRSVMDYLEGVGPELAYQGPAVPFVAVPTTAGTGSEATKNAVLSVAGEQGFKKSFRDDRLVAEHAVVDPDLLATCPPEVLAANGMDALTQLLESYVSTRANAFTDALALSGLEAVREGLLPWFEAGGPQPLAQEKMAYASLVSGVCLAQTGLGSVHGLASPLGAFYPIPHGVVCGTLVAACTAVNLEALRERDRRDVALDKYGRAGQVLAGRAFDSRSEAADALVRLLEDWTARLALPRLGRYGLSEAGLDHVVAHSRGSSMKTNPIALTDAEVRECLARRL
ncbi:MAG: iron-containing alcohol dehydrogenase [Gammaproteobacteria bacterium]|jgi:alcohol dehydrogenase|nr:iron-containing alcohol dehydrogenase [Gammaproteobacteria bacterium]